MGFSKEQQSLFREYVEDDEMNPTSSKKRPYLRNVLKIYITYALEKMRPRGTSCFITLY
jgi:hypothetical protein